MGKLSTRELKKLLRCIKRDERVIVPPHPGFDSGVHLIDNKCLVVSTDPCIGVPEDWFGWLLIHYAASDVALFGAKPEYCTINLLGSIKTKMETFYAVMNQACIAAEELGMAIVTGHTGVYDGLSSLVGVCTAYGTVSKDKLITPDGAKPGDYILFTKSLGLEIATNFAIAHKAFAEQLFGSGRVIELSKLVPMQSCVKEALLLSEVGGVHAMHDTTEGGLTSALNEMAENANVGFEIEWEKIPLSTDVRVLADFFKLSEEQILSMSSTGTILAAVSPEAKDKVARVLRQNNVEASFLGVFSKDKRRTLIKNGKIMRFPEKAEDPYERILSGKL